MAKFKGQVLFNIRGDYFVNGCLQRCLLWCQLSMYLAVASASNTQLPPKVNNLSWSVNRSALLVVPTNSATVTEYNNYKASAAKVTGVSASSDFLLTAIGSIGNCSGYFIAISTR